MKYRKNIHSNQECHSPSVGETRAKTTRAFHYSICQTSLSEGFPPPQYCFIFPRLHTQCVTQKRLSWIFYQPPSPFNKLFLPPHKCFLLTQISPKLVFTRYRRACLIPMHSRPPPKKMCSCHSFIHEENVLTRIKCTPGVSVEGIKVNFVWGTHSSHFWLSFPALWKKGLFRR